MRPSILLFLPLLIACAPAAPEIRALPIVSISETVPGASGEILFPSHATSSTKVTVRLEGLAPEEPYLLCLNPGEPDSATSDLLGKLQIHGWPLGAVYENPAGFTEGHWNFVRIDSDASGRFERTFELPLPPLDYRIRLLVKADAVEGSPAVAQSDAFLMSVSGPPLNRWLAGTVVVLGFVPLLFMARSRSRERGDSGAGASASASSADPESGRPGSAESLQPASPGVPNALHTSDSSEADYTHTEPIDDFDGAAEFSSDSDEMENEAELPYTNGTHVGGSELHRLSADLCAPIALQLGSDLTLVDRARIDGTLKHGRRYSWIEIENRRKHFRARQALVFQILCEHDPNCDGLPQEEIIREWEAVYEAKRANPVRVRDIFRACADEPGDFIVRVPGPASVYRLGLPIPSKPESQDPVEEAPHELENASECESSICEQREQE